MTDLVQSILLLLFLLQIKHMFADYFLQSGRMLQGRGQYLHMGRAQHCLVHAIGSAICLVIVGSPAWFILAIIALEWVVHFHIDWGKGAYSAAKAHGPAHAGYWRAFGFDQLLHQLTYIAMIWAWILVVT